MNFADNPLIRRTLAPQPSPDPYSEPRKRLFDELIKMRERAATLANEIHRDLPDFTVHDITHLDALWEMADLIAGPDYPLNPLEAFALGSVFLLHDLGLGLAAWPGGLDELKKGPGWQDALSTYLRKHLERIPTAEELASPPSEVERMAVQERLRSLHAEHAERLAFASWRHKGGPEYHLIEDPDLRHALGPLLGKIAHSHWWTVSRLGNEFGMVRGTLANCPGDWTLDPLKIAVLLRTADAAHLDARRAPGFLIALRRPEGISEKHWGFQNHLLKARVEDDRLVCTTAQPFPSEEADAWWLCEEALRMVDRELHQVDALLADLYRPRLQARGMAGIDSPHRLKEYVEVSGWTPVDARLHVSNVADLVRRLGGEQLYGNNPTVPLRELIQNASDAVRARRLIEPRPEDWGRVIVRLGRDEQGPWVEVEDTGIGMSEIVLTGPLLDFGTTYWGSALMRDEHEGLWAKGFEPTGRFGIGFFSVFMWGDRIRVTTCKYDDGPRETRVLEFRSLMSARPLVRPAKPEEQIRVGGTRVRVWLNQEPSKKGGLLWPERGHERDSGSVKLEELCAWIAPALDVDVFVESEEGISRVVAASDWLSIDGAELLARVSLDRCSSEEETYGPLLSIRHGDTGRILGRAALVFERAPVNLKVKGVVTSGGLRVGELARDFLGVLVGPATNAARDRGVTLLKLDQASLASWASDQALLSAQNTKDPVEQVRHSIFALGYGGELGKSPIAICRDGALDQKSLSLWASSLSKIRIFSLDMIRPTMEDLYPGVIGTFTARSMHENSIDPMEIIVKSLKDAWGCDIVYSFATAEDYLIGVRENGIPFVADYVNILVPKNSRDEPEIYSYEWT